MSLLCKQLDVHQGPEKHLQKVYYLKWANHASFGFHSLFSQWNRTLAAELAILFIGLDNDA